MPAALLQTSGTVKYLPAHCNCSHSSICSAMASGIPEVEQGHSSGGSQLFAACSGVLILIFTTSCDLLCLLSKRSFEVRPLLFLCLCILLGRRGLAMTTLDHCCCCPIVGRTRFNQPGGAPSTLTGDGRRCVV